VPGSFRIGEPIHLTDPCALAKPGEGFQAALRDPLSGAEKIVLWALLALAIAFGVIVEIRSACLQSRHTDLDVYLRGAWTIRSGEGDLYKTNDDNNWPYLYPPLFAILMIPLADPPAHVSRAGYVPFAFSVGLWYVVCLACLGWGGHAMANACQRAWNASFSQFSRGWWALRMVPLLVCLPGIGSDLARGQVNMLVLLLLGLMIASAMRGTSQGSRRAGIFLGVAICLKVIPVFFLIYPLWRRDWRWLSTSAVVVVVGLFAIPLAVLGPARTSHYYQEFSQITLGSALLDQGDQLHVAETSNTADNQSLMAIIQNTLFSHENRIFVPAYYTHKIRLAVLLIGVLLVGATFAGAWRPDPSIPSDSPFIARRAALRLSTLILVMLLMSPVCHMAYFGLCLPLVMALLATFLEPPSLQNTVGSPPRIDRWYKLLLAALAANVLVGLFVRLPGFDPLRHMGLAMYGTLLLWWVGICAIRREKPAVRASAPESAAGL